MSLDQAIQEDNIHSAILNPGIQEGSIHRASSNQGIHDWNIHRESLNRDIQGEYIHSATLNLDIQEENILYESSNAYSKQFTTKNLIMLNAFNILLLNKKHFILFTPCVKICCTYLHFQSKVSKGAKIRSRYNQVPHPTL